MQKYNNTRIIIGLDHGYGNIKTAHRIFRTGVECFEEEPIVSMNYIKYKDKYLILRILKYDKKIKSILS